MDFWDELNEPDANERDPYGELVNQCGHTLLGTLAASLICVFCFVTFGAMPYRSIALAAVILPYLGMEAFVQGWKAGDSWFDALMVSFGAAFALLPFREVTVTGWEVNLSFNPAIWLGIFAFWLLFLLPRIVRRYRASQQAQKWI